MKPIFDTLIRFSFYPAVTFTLLYLVRYLTGWHISRWF
jgi:hypothetical protein